jgi:hypothetical protein
MSSEMLARPQVNIKRLNINLPESVYDNLQLLATQSQRSMTDIIRTALSLVKIAIEANQAGNKLAVVDHYGKLQKEIVIT